MVEKSVRGLCSRASKQVILLMEVGMGMNILELVENYGPIVFANSELGIIIQRNGAYYYLAVQGKNGWEWLS